MQQSSIFLEPGHLIDGDLELVLVKAELGDPAKGYGIHYHFEMRHSEESVVLGRIRFRTGAESSLFDFGNIGYEVNEKFRGHRYAARSCRLLFPLAVSHGLKSVWLTVDPNNAPSLKTCEIIGAKRVETVRIKKDHPMYGQGSPYRRRFRVDLANIQTLKVKPEPSIQSESFIGKEVHIKIDRPLGSNHPRHPHILFCYNYGYVPDIIGGDGDNLDAYLLGVFTPVSEYMGRCIAVIRRRDEDDDKLIIVPEGVNYSDEQILALTEFIERFHDSYIIRKNTNSD
jgi:inorganic pyrophosphatase